MHLEETHLLIFLCQVAVLLGLSRGFGMLLARFGQPSITGEILVGVLLGPTILRRTLPGLHSALFPDDPTQHAMLQAVAWLGILFFLLVSGLDTDLSSVWRQKGRATVIALSDLVLPLVIAFIPCLFVAERYLVPDGSRLLFAMFIGTILTISALPVTARALQELGIYRTDVGLLIICALSINDVAGWALFAIILGSSSEQGMHPREVAAALAATVIFTGALLTLGRRLTHHALTAFNRLGLPEPGASLTLICLLGLLSGALTLWIGIHALFGFFIAGIMAGDSKALSEQTRNVIAQMVRAVLVPLFFASIGLQIDFIAGFDPFIVVFLLVLGVFGRYVGAWAGSSLTRQPREHRHLISVAHVPGGEMQIVVGMLALEYRVITETVFVAIIFGAVFTSVVLAPWMKVLLNRRKPGDITRYFHYDGLAPDLQANVRDQAIAELGRLAAAHAPNISSDTIIELALQREEIQGTALDHGIAIPHARIDGLKEPVVAVGRSRIGIDWNAVDGKATELIFLILTPATGTDDQLRILRALAVAMRNQTNRDALRQAEGHEGMWAVLRTIVTEA